MGRPEIYPKANFSSSSPPPSAVQKESYMQLERFFWGGERGDSFPLSHSSIDWENVWEIKRCALTSPKKRGAFLFFPPLPPILGAGNFSAIVKMWGTPYPTKTMERLGGRDWGCDGEAM